MLPKPGMVLLVLFCNASWHSNVAKRTCRRTRRHRRRPQAVEAASFS